MLNQTFWVRLLSLMVVLPLSLVVLSASFPIPHVFLLGIGVRLGFEWLRLFHIKSIVTRFDIFLFYGFLLISWCVGLFLGAREGMGVVLCGAAILYYGVRFRFYETPKKAYVLFWGLLYIMIPQMACFYILTLQKGFLFLLFALSIIWANDIGAYMVGSWLKGPKLCPSISPNKTISGFLGGLILGSVTAVAYASLMVPSGVILFMICSIPLGVVGVLGDLFESKMKRICGVKDSGHLIPGHGGLLDRLDSTLFVLPVWGFFLWVMIYVGLL